MAGRYWRAPLDRGPPGKPPGKVTVIAERCKGCGFCIEFCPRDVLAESPSFNRRGYHPPEAVAPERCADCRLCELLCPEFAIYVMSGAVPAAAGAVSAEVPFDV